MASFQTLPYDLIYFIFNTDYISFSDLLQLSSVCQVFKRVASSDGLWRSRFRKRWPICEKVFVSNSQDWKTLFRWRYYCERKVRQKLSELSVNCYHVENIVLQDIVDLYQVVYKYCHNFIFILDELDTFRTSERQDCLPEKFYSDRVWRGMKIMRLMMTCVRYVETPESFSLLDGAVLASNLFEHFEFTKFSKTKDVIKEIATLAEQRLQVVYPNHPFFVQYNFGHNGPSIKRRKVNREKQPNLSNSTTGLGQLAKSLWGTAHCKQVLESIHKVMFGYLDFQISNADSDCFSISEVAKGRGTKELIAVIFSAVAAQLGVLAQPVALTGVRIQFLKWKPNPNKNPGEVYYVDVEDDWKSKNSDFIFRHYMVSNENAASVLQEPNYKPLKMFTLLISETVRFHYHSFFKHYTSLRVALSHLNLVLRFLESYERRRTLNLFYIIFKNLSLFLLNVCNVQPKTIVSRTQARIPDETFPERHKYRHTNETSGMIYAIGMIMRHRWELYRCVIYSWDAHKTKEWSELFEIGRDEQPYYRVLLDDDIVAYVPQADLEIDDEKRPIRSIKVGKYFQSFHGSYYKPNKTAQSVYSDDCIIRRRALQGR